MRLLKRLPGDDGFELTTFDDNSAPLYAILSHTWTAGQEITYKELLAGIGINKSGYAKLRFCGDRARADGLQYFWVNTCCIDKATSDELSTAINSMFRWYQRAARCYVYLTDVSVPEEVANPEAYRISWEQAFRHSRWFTRGWTLQELLAPASVEFFSHESKRLGSRISLEQEINEITKIPNRALRGQKLHEFSVEERMRWAAGRTTTMKEDKIYCLLGIFSVFLPLIYGEGEHYATLRLKEEIQKRQHGQRTDLQDLPTLLLLPFPRNELFVGRESQLQSIEQTLLVPAISRESFELAYREIATRLQLPGTADSNTNINKLVKEALSTDSSGRWLMIVDNADDPAVLLSPVKGDPKSPQLGDYLPHSHRGAVLFTTRNYLSLFEHAGTEIELFSEQFEDPSRYREIDRTIAKTWHISFDQIRKQDPLAAEYLSFIACVDRINIPQSLLPHRGSAVQRVKALGTLTGYAFITERQQITQGVDRERFWDMHRLVHIASITWLHGHSEWASSVQTVVNRLKEVVPWGGQEGKELWVPYLSHAVHAAGHEDTVNSIGTSSLLDRVGQCQNSLGQYAAAEVSHRQALPSWREVLGPEHPDTLTSMRNLAEVLDRQGKYEEAEAISRQTLARREKVLGPAHPDTLTSMNNLAQVLKSQGKYKEAETMNRQTLALYQMVLGLEHPHTLMSMSNLAGVLDSQGKFEEVEAMNRQTLARREKVLGPEHPHTLTSMNNLALVLDRQGKCKEAETMHRQTLARKEKVLGHEHPDTLASMNNLAQVLNSQGKYKEAETMNRQTLALYQTVLGLEHPHTLTSMSNLAGVLDSQGKYEEAEAMNRQTLALYQTVLGPEHPHMLTSMSNLTGVLDRQGKYEEAETMHRQTLARKEKVLGHEHSDTLASMNNLAQVLNSQGKYREAETINRQTLALYQMVLGLEHPHTLMSMSNLAGVLDSQGKYEEAEAMNRQSLALYQTVLGPEHPHTLTSALCGSVTGLFGGTMRTFLNTENLSPYYRLKAYIVLSAADEENKYEENLVATRYWLKKATEALEETKRVYIHDPDDTKLLQTTANTIEEENKALQMREKAFYSDDDSDEAGY
ncbi:TPR-like protein [Ophiobolus disseminans]|uniref:TPR-like protein n=1 Tax=Ophiobolus disseminans TaxID=1469910 RepID=A0A6A6ZC97_9PLEO|nr:TPR-like protein [Ophiobolus disseminans]